jgi:hypothetical protein
MPAIVTAAVANDFKNRQIRRFEAVFAIEDLLGIVTLDSLHWTIQAWREAIVRQNRGAWGEGCPLGSLASELANDSEPARKRLAGSFATWHDRIERGAYQSARARRACGVSRSA